MAGSTAQLLLACKVKADPNSASMKRLEVASNAVRKATENLVKAAQQAQEQEEDNDNVDLNKSAVNTVVEVSCFTLIEVNYSLNKFLIACRKLMLEAKFYAWNVN